LGFVKHRQSNEAAMRHKSFLWSTQKGVSIAF
jgi:hypothetical protein